MTNDHHSSGVSNDDRGTSTSNENDERSDDRSTVY